jgi:hypothetical protein
MSCIYSDFNGKCTLWDENYELPCAPDGDCVCEDDPNPEDSCENYESDEPTDDPWWE